MRATLPMALAAFTLARAAPAQVLDPPWSSTALTESPEPARPRPPARAPAPWPVPATPPAPVTPRLPPPFEIVPARGTEASDPAAGHFFQLPTARVLRLGDVLGHYIGHLGWVGARAGLTRHIDVGAGLPFYFVGVSVDARVALVQRRGLAVAWWAYASVPLQIDGERSTTNLGFTWAHAGMGWLTGPLVSLWGERAGLHAGLHVAQRTGLGGLWALAHATVEFRVAAGMKLVAQLASFYELSQENGERERALVGNVHPRFLPYILVGSRFFTRRFAADFGILMPLTESAPLHTDRLPALPWVSLAHRF